MQSTCTVRVAGSPDFPAIADLVVAAYNSIPGAVPDPDYDAELRRVAERAELAAVLVATSHDGVVVGSLTYISGPGPFAELAREGEAEIRMFAVAPNCQGQGVGGQLLDAALVRAAKGERDAVVLSTSPWMTNAQGLYRSRGFVRTPSLDRSERSSGTSFELLAYRLEFVVGR